MSRAKSEIREKFRGDVFRRASYRCQGPGCSVKATKETADVLLDAHHVTPRDDFNHGGYVPENGIALCKESESSCHQKAEDSYPPNPVHPEFTPEKLYAIIKSSREAAFAADARAKGRGR